MKVNLLAVLFMLAVGLYIIENVNINIATSLYDYDCISRITNDESDDVFSNAKFLPSLFAGAIGTLVIAGIVSCWLDGSPNTLCNQDIKHEILADVLMLTLCVASSVFYFVIITLRQYRECSDRYNEVIALVVTPVIVFNGPMSIYLFIKYVILCGRVILKYKGGEQGVTELKQELDETKRELEKMRADAMQFDAMQADAMQPHNTFA